MNLKGKSVIYEEAELKNGKIFDAITFEEYGYQLNKLYLRYNDFESDEDITSSMDEDYGGYGYKLFHNPSLLETTNKSVELSESICLQNTDSIRLMKQLTEIEKLGQVLISYKSNEDCSVYYYPQFLIYELSNMAVKLPKATVVKEGDDVVENRYSFEYLIYPDFTVNEELLNELRALTKKDLTLDILGHPANVEGRGFTRPFSLELYKILYCAYLNVCDESKGINNAINLAEHNKVADNNLYSIYQRAQSHKKDTIAYTGYSCFGPGKERSFKEILADLSLSMAEVSIIAQSPTEREAFLEEHKNDFAYTAVNTFVRNFSENPFKAMDNYVDMQTRRCYIRKLLYQLNMGWYDDFNQRIEYLNTVQPDLKLNPTKALMKEKIQWYTGGIWGIEKCQFDGVRHKKCKVQ